MSTLKEYFLNCVLFRSKEKNHTFFGINFWFNIFVLLSIILNLLLTTFLKK